MSACLSVLCAFFAIVLLGLLRRLLRTRTLCRRLTVSRRSFVLNVTPRPLGTDIGHPPQAWAAP